MFTSWGSVRDNGIELAQCDYYLWPHRIGVAHKTSSSIKHLKLVGKSSSVSSLYSLKSTRSAGSPRVAAVVEEELEEPASAPIDVPAVHWGAGGGAAASASQGTAVGAVEEAAAAAAAAAAAGEQRAEAAAPIPEQRSATLPPVVVKPELVESMQPPPKQSQSASCSIL